VLLAGTSVEVAGTITAPGVVAIGSIGNHRLTA